MRTRCQVDINAQENVKMGVGRFLRFTLGQSQIF
jgi:hypothetical protein